MITLRRLGEGVVRDDLPFSVGECAGSSSELASSLSLFCFTGVEVAFFGEEGSGEGELLDVEVALLVGEHFLREASRDFKELLVFAK